MAYIDLDREQWHLILSFRAPADVILLLFEMDGAQQEVKRLPTAAKHAQVSTSAPGGSYKGAIQRLRQAMVDALHVCPPPIASVWIILTKASAEAQWCSAHQLLLLSGAVQISSKDTCTLTLDCFEHCT
jgi:hypothetical protein